MTPEEAAELAMLAKGLWQRIGDPLRKEIGRVLLPFPNAAFAEQLLRQLCRENDDFSLKALQDGLDAQMRRTGEMSIQRKLEATAAQREHEARRAAEAARIGSTWKPVDDLLGALSDADLADLKADAVKSFPFMAKSDPRTHKGLRAVMYERLSKQAPTRAEVAVSNGVTHNVPTIQDFDL